MTETAIEGLTQAIKTRLEGSATYAMDIYFARDFSILTGRPETSVLMQVRKLNATYLADARGMDKYERCLKLACNSIWTWFSECDQWQLSDIPSALEVYDPILVWAVLIGQGWSAENGKVNR